MRRIVEGLVVGILILASTLPDSGTTMLITSTPTYANDPISEAKSAIMSAEYSMANFWHVMEDHWSEVSDEIRRSSFTDAYKARFDSHAANNEFDQKQYDKAIEFAYSACFLAERACYRIYANATWNRILAANAVISGIPSYIAKPAQALALLKKAIEDYKLNYLQSVFSVQWPGLYNAKQYVRAMPESSDRLYYKDNGPAKLADLAREEAARYVETQEPVARKAMSSRLSSITNQFWLVVALQFLFCAVPFVIVFGFIKKMLSGWLRSLHVSWRGDMFKGRFPGSWLISANLAVCVVGSAFLYVILEFGLVVEDYGLLVVPDRFLVTILGASIVILFSSLVFALSNYFSIKRKATAYASVFFSLIGVCLQIYAIVYASRLFVSVRP